MTARSRPVDANRMLLGAWLFLSPWLLGLTGNAAASWTAWIFGPVIFGVGINVSSVARTARHSRAYDAVGVLAGDMVFLSPWLLGYAGVRLAAVNAWLVGLAVAALSGWKLTDRRDNPDGVGTR